MYSWDDGMQPKQYSILLWSQTDLLLFRTACSIFSTCPKLVSGMSTLNVLRIAAPVMRCTAEMWSMDKRSITNAPWVTTNEQSSQSFESWAPSELGFKEPRKFLQRAGRQKFSSSVYFLIQGFEKGKIKCSSIQRAARSSPNYNWRPWRNSNG